MAKDSFLLYTSMYDPVKDLTDEQLGRLFRAIFLYKLKEPYEVGPDLDLKMAFGFFKVQIDINDMKYDKIVEERSKAGKKGGAPKGNKNASKKNKTSKTSKTSINDNVNANDNDNANEDDDKEERVKKKKKAPPFEPPTPAQVKEYIAEKGYKIDADAFCDHYTSNGWKVGNAQMKDWQAAVRTWAKKEQQFATHSTPHGTSVGERAYNMLHFEYEGHPEMWYEEEKKMKELQKYL